MEKTKQKFIFTETSQMHDIVTEVYEAMMDGEHTEAIAALELLGEKGRALIKDMKNKEE